MNRRPFDPRLLRRVPAARRDLAVLAVLGGLTALLAVSCTHLTLPTIA
nr:hypothetical protein [Micromonospora globispora]